MKSEPAAVGEHPRRLRKERCRSGLRSAQLRIERQGGGNGRVYDIALHVQDPAGNRTATTVQVMVPANGFGAIDDGPHYTVTSACP